MIARDAAIADELPDAEVVFAIVSPLGTPLDHVEGALLDALKSHNYELQLTVRISKLLDELDKKAGQEGERPADRQERLMAAGTRLRDQHGGDYLALMAIAAINADRLQERAGGTKPRERCAYMIRSLKHPDEVARLRHVYGKGFFLLGVSAPKPVRRAALIDQNFALDEANRLLEKDAAEEGTPIGQQTRDTYHLADAYLQTNGADDKTVDVKIKRIVDLLMSCPFHPPSREEHGMFMAYAAALRSSDLSRQVGAVITNRRGDVVASGANDAPAPQGGTYWPPSNVEWNDARNESAGADYMRGYDSNERERNKILVRVIGALIPESMSKDADEMSPDERSGLVKKYKSQLRGSGILDLTEFGRAVHAEMAALTSCARTGVTPMDGTLYCTTFPCHNCAKHIVASGITSVIYVEPYPKSKAKDLHGDAIFLKDEDEDDDDNNHRVVFRPFEGIGPRRFVDLFSLAIGSGRVIHRKAKDADGERMTWTRGVNSIPRLPLDPRSYLDREDDEAKLFKKKSDVCETSRA